MIRVNNQANCQPGKLRKYNPKEQLKTLPGDLTTDPIKINATFRNFHKLLYKLEYAGITQQQTFLDQLQFQSLTEDERVALDRALTIQDLYDAMNSMNNGKAPDTCSSFMPIGLMGCDF